MPSKDKFAKTLADELAALLETDRIEAASDVGLPDTASVQEISAAQKRLLRDQQQTMIGTMREIDASLGTDFTGSVKFMFWQLTTLMECLPGQQLTLEAQRTLHMYMTELARVDQQASTYDSINQPDAMPRIIEGFLGLVSPYTQMQNFLYYQNYPTTLAELRDRYANQ